MSKEVTMDEAAKCLRKASYIKLDLNAFLVIAKKPQDEVSKQFYVDEYGDAVYLPSPEGLLAEFSNLSLFLQFRNEAREKVKGSEDSTFNRRIAMEFVCKMFDALGMKTETDEKFNVYISKNELGKIKNNHSFDVKELFSHITRAGSSGARRGNNTQWG